MRYLFVLTLVCWAFASPAAASSHREAPAISEDPVADNTDVYAFVSPDDPTTVTLIANYVPLELPAGGPNFHGFGENVRYSIHIDNDGDVRADIVYHFLFQTTVRDPSTFLYNTGPISTISDPNRNVVQTYSVTRVAGRQATVIASGLLTPPPNIGPRSTPNYQALADEAVYPLPDGGKVFAGQRDDGFFVDVGAIFDLLGLRPFNSSHVIPLPSGLGVDGLAGRNVHSLALQIPIDQVRAADDVIGVWATSSRRRITIRGFDGKVAHLGPWVQVSRLGLPLVNEVLVPLGYKDRYNGSSPSDDNDQLAPYILNPQPAGLIQSLYGFSTPAPPRTDLFEVVMTGLSGLNRPANAVPGDVLRLNLSIPPSTNPDRLGVLRGDPAGFPNGRRPADDVTDVLLTVTALGLTTGSSFTFTDGVDANDQPFLTEFPYLALPHEGYAQRPPCP